MTAIITLAACFTVACWLLLYPKKPAQTDKKQRRAVAAKRSYSAASIQHNGGACAAVKTLGDTRFLAATVPLIPLPGCDAATCDCKYIQHEDRRIGDERRALFSTMSDLYALSGKTERRAEKGRRNTDQLSDKASGFGYDDIDLIGRA